MNRVVQNVDFLPQRVAVKTVGFNISELIWALIVLIIVLCLISMSSVARIFVAETYKDRSEEQLKVLQTANSSLEVRTTREPDAALIARVEALRKSLGEQKVLAASVSSYQQSISMSELLSDIAKIDRESIWINAINIQESDGTLTLKGFSSESASIPQLIRNLGQRDSFSKSVFNDLTISQVDATTLAFVVSGMMRNPQES